MRYRFLISMLFFLLLFSAGCVSESLEEAQVDFCQALVIYGEAVGELQNVNASTTVDELQSARDDVAHAREAVVKAAGDLREARLRVVEDAWDNAQEAIDDISGDATLAEAAATIRGQSLKLAAEIDKITTVSCGRR